VNFHDQKDDRTLKQIVQLKEADGVEMISLMDKSIDFLSTIHCFSPCSARLVNALI
jgi:hypothetical protein